ncbi:MAG: glycoside hydrolase family 5 protein [Treponema sp.]|nr:glycoside hydrolase family 5 protein [Treponema sp.]
MRKQFLSLCAAILMTSGTIFATGKTKAQIFVENMGIGINLGNTMEACGTWINSSGGVRAFETAWGSPVITKEIIQGYADAGFKTLRVPVAWSNMMSKDGKYTIKPELLSRVKEIVSWAVDCCMYVIVNEHWDYGWIETEMISNKDEAMKKYKAIWSQVSEALKDFDDKVIFESQNEELGNFKNKDGNPVWNSYNSSDTKGKKIAYDLSNEINQTFVDLVRASGGNNATRLLLISGINTDIGKTCDPMFKMPEDPAAMCAVSVHYYTPSTFAILEKDESWGKNRTTWGTPKDLSELAANMKKVKTTFVDTGIPVIIGEYGCPTKNKEKESIQNYLKYVCLHAYKNGMCPVLWDIQKKGTEQDPFSHYDRKTRRLTDPVVQQNFREIVETTERL